MENNNNIDDKKIKMGALEALLFYYGEPIEIEKIARILNEPKDILEKILEEFEKSLEEDISRGICVLKHDKTIELVTKKNFAFILRKIFEEEFDENITPAALETLSIIAYLGPISRGEIDYIRGVNSTFILRNLLIRGLILKKLRPGRKNTYEYVVSHDFLKHLGIKNIEELPDYEKYKNLLSKFHFVEEKKEEEEKSQDNQTLFDNEKEPSV
jgi:segregation and condensation protein B